MRRFSENIGLGWFFNQSSCSEYDIYFKKRNFFLLSFSIIVFIALCCLCAFLLSLNNLDNATHESQNLHLIGVLVYLGVWFLSLPLFFMSFSYNSICNILYNTEKLKKLFQKRAELITNSATTDKIDITLIQKNTEVVSAFNKTVFDSRIIMWDQEIISWCKVNKNNFTKKQFSAISNENTAIYNVLAIYINSALSFCSKYDKNIQNGKYKEPYIPPMFFNAEDITAFNQAKKIYKIG